MYNISDLLAMAQALAFLSYFIGTLVYAIPLPVYGVKKWAPRLITDSVYSMVLIAVYTTILDAVSYLQGLISQPWPNYLYWLESSIATLSLGYQTLEGLYTIFTSIPVYGNYIQNLVPAWIVFSTLSLALSYLAFIQLLSLFILTDFPILLAIGIMLFALPFRIGRFIGASLMSSAIVFYIGLPYMPDFLTNLGFSTGQLFQVIDQAGNLNTTAYGLFNYIYGNVMPQLIAVTMFGPSMYLAILASISIGLATAISGVGGRVPFPIEVP